MSYRSATEVYAKGGKFLLKIEERIVNLPPVITINNEPYEVIKESRMITKVADEVFDTKVYIVEKMIHETNDSDSD